MKVKNISDRGTAITGFPEFQPGEVRPIENEADARYLLENPNIEAADDEARALIESDVIDGAEPNISAADDDTVRGVETETRRKKR